MVPALHNRDAGEPAPSSTLGADDAVDEAREGSPREQWLEWHSQRERSLHEPHGWLSLTSLTWLGPEPTAVPEFPGSWTALPLEAGGVRATDRIGGGAGPRDSTGVEGDTAPMDSTRVSSGDEDGTPPPACSA